MTIPNHTTIRCPNCQTSEDGVIADSSVGPAGRVSDTPLYCMRSGALWQQVNRCGETFVSCTTCGTAEFTTLANLCR